MHLNKAKLEQSPKVDQLRELAEQRDKAGFDAEVSINRTEISAQPRPDGREGSEVFVGETRIGSNGGWSGLAQMLRSPKEGVAMPVPVLRSLDPGTVNQLLDVRVTQVDKQVRIWTPDDGSERIIRGIVSPGYKMIPAAEQVNQLLDRVHESELVNHRLVSWHSDPDSWSAEVVDADRPLGIDGAQDFNQLLEKDTTIHLRDPNTGGFHDPEGSPTFPGFKFTANDVGGGSCRVMSYLWRLACSNGMVAMVAQAALRAIHKGSGSWTGNLFTGQDWLDMLSTAQAEVLNPDTDATEVFDAVRQLANRPSLPAVRQSLDEALKLTSEGQGVSRWALSQGAAAAANKADNPTDRQTLQRWAGHIMGQPFAESVPTLSSMVA